MADPPIDDETMGETCWGDPKNGFEWFLYVLMGKMISNIIDVFVSHWILVFSMFF